MDTGDELRTRAVALVVLHEHLSCLLVQCRFRIGINEEAFDGNKNVLDAVCRLPVLLQGIHANLPCRANVGMEEFGRKPTWFQKRVRV